MYTVCVVNCVALSHKVAVYTVFNSLTRRVCSDAEGFEKMAIGNIYEQQNICDIYIVYKNGLKS